MTTPVSSISRTNITALDPNLATGQVADPALRKACFDEIYNYFDTFVTAYNAFVANGGIGTANLADLSVTSAKIALLAVTAAQLADSSITSAKIVDGAISTADIADGAITSLKIADGTIVNADINAAAAIDATKLGAGTVNNTKLGYLSTVTSDVQSQLNSKGTGAASGAGNPNGVLTPTAVGQIYTDTNTGLIYTATALTNTSWIIQTEYYGMALQASINSDYQIAQQGTSFTNPANNAYTLDMNMIVFFNSGTLPTIVHSQVLLASGEVPKSKYAYNINWNGIGAPGAGDDYGTSERIEHGVQALCGNGRKITISKMYKSDIAGKRIAVMVRQNYGTGGSPTGEEICTPTATTIRTLSSTMTLYTWTFTTNTLTGKTFGTNNDDYLQISEFVYWGTSFATANFGGGTAETFVAAGNVTSTQKQVNAGDTALPYQPKTLADEKNACYRYFHRFGGTAGGGAYSVIGTGSQLLAATTAYVPISLVEMRVSPAVSYSGIFRMVQGTSSFPVTNIYLADFLPDRVTFNVTITGTLGAGAVILQANNDATAYVQVDARL